MPPRRRLNRTNWTNPKKHKLRKGSTGFSDAEIEESEESFSSLARYLISKEAPYSHKTATKLTLSDQLIQLSHDFGVFSRAFGDIYTSPEPEAGKIQKAKLALEVFGATLDVVDTLHSLE